MFGLFKLKKTIGRDSNVDLNDTLRTKHALFELGYYKRPPQGISTFPDYHLFKGIERFQMDNGLHKDGVIKPGGKTEAVLRRLLVRQVVRGDRKALNANRLFSAFDKFSKPEFHAKGSAESTRCCATGTCDISF